MLKYKIALVGLVLLPCASAMAADTTVMQCQLANGRDVKVAWNGENLTYVYGKSGKQSELELPNNPNDFYTMTYGHPSFPSGEGVYYRFTNGKYDYVTYFSESGQGTVSNLGIFKDKKLVKQIKCKDYFHTQLNNIYQPVSDKINTDGDTSSDWVVNEDDSASSTPNTQNDQSTNESSQQSQLPSSDNPVKIQIQDITSDHKYGISATHNVSRHIYIYSLVDSVTITGVSVDHGSCYNWNTKQYTIAYGKRLDFSLPIDNQVAYANNGWAWYPAPGKKYNQCMWSEIVVKTNKGEWTFPLNQ